MELLRGPLEPVARLFGVPPGGAALLNIPAPPARIALDFYGKKRRLRDA